MRTDKLGSIWRQWDLHFHTPSSFDYKHKGATNEALVEGLIESGIQVVAVTDHHQIDVGRIRAMQAAAGDRLTVLPGIELRSQLGASASVHFIGVFSEDADLEDLWTKLQGLDISPADVRKVGDERVFVGFERGCDLIHQLGGIVTVHAGKKSNSIENINNAEVLRQAVKADYARRYIDAYEVGRLEDCDGYRRVVFPAIGKSMPLLLCSDNHDIRSYGVRTPMWIRADPGFAGLLQLLNEPEGRIFLGESPESVLRVRRNPTKYISQVSFKRSGQARNDEKWFSGQVELNHGLVAIIGNKGSGKSALADIIALLGDSGASEHFSFLNPKRFLEPKANLGEKFQAEFRWFSGAPVSRRLDAEVDPISAEQVKYIPQGFLEAICNPSGAGGGEFYSELMQVIFSHVDDADRLGRNSLEELIDYLTKEKEQRIDQLRLQLRDVNATIVGMEQQLESEYRRSLEAQLELKLAELTAHEQAKPLEVPEPAQDASAVEATTAISSRLDALLGQQKELTDAIAREEEVIRTSTQKLATADKLTERLRTLERLVADFRLQSAEDLRSLGLAENDLISFESNGEPIRKLREELLLLIANAREALREDVEGSLAAKYSELERNIEATTAELDVPSQRYQAYLRQMEEWSKLRDTILGENERSGSVRELEHRLRSLELLPEEVRRRQERRWELVSEIFEAKVELLQAYRTLYEPVQRFIDAHPISRQHQGLEFVAAIMHDEFADGFLDMINQRRKGSFHGESDGRARLGELIARSTLDSMEGLRTFIEALQQELAMDQRDGGRKRVALKEQLRQAKTPLELYDFVFGLEYLKPKFELRWQGKNLEQLSPGERGTLLLLFYLLIDKRDCPLILDQPEENLDNQTIASTLVPAIKEAKSRRQVVVVTHNPNLAVVCDADQVIHSRLDRLDGNRVHYTSGAIENPAITQLIVDVLEGTKPAFDLRGAKYDILDRGT